MPVDFSIVAENPEKTRELARPGIESRAARSVKRGQPLALFFHRR
jgi:hypothetical protein